MLGSAITALVIVGFLVTGVYIANVSDSNFIQSGEEPVSESFFADLESLSDVDKNLEAVEQTAPAPTENQSAITAFFRALRQQQSEESVKPTTSVLTYRPSYIVPSTSQSGESAAPTQSSQSHWFPSTNTESGSSSGSGGSSQTTIPTSSSGGTSSGSTSSGTGSQYVPSIPPVTESPPVFESDPTEPVIPPSTPVVTPSPATSLPPIPSWIADILNQDWGDPDEDFYEGITEGE